MADWNPKAATIQFCRSESNYLIVKIVVRSESNGLLLTCNDPVFMIDCRSESNDPFAKIVARSQTNGPLVTPSNPVFMIIDRSGSNDPFFNDRWPIGIQWAQNTIFYDRWPIGIHDPVFAIVRRLESNDLSFKIDIKRNPTFPFRQFMDGWNQRSHFYDRFMIIGRSESNE